MIMTEKYKKVKLRIPCSYSLLVIDRDDVEKVRKQIAALEDQIILLEGEHSEGILQMGRAQKIEETHNYFLFERITPAKKLEPKIVWYNDITKIYSPIGSGFEEEFARKKDSKY